MVEFEKYLQSMVEEAERLSALYGASVSVTVDLIVYKCKGAFGMYIRLFPAHATTAATVYHFYYSKLLAIANELRGA